ncbi:hypothetical protein GE061_006698 [Apolygus lucorum]|uniref:C-type lectin domain-containing protein n=1 Tax=Apolygus lucorum TaxID=248454 RepID=A0A8S9WYH9_APOLU|nr:hypothetical protein GE061_006698 [Apolygus lucorum]
MKGLQISLLLAFVGSLQARSANLQSNQDHSVGRNRMMLQKASFIDENLTPSFTETRTKKFDVINEKVTWVAALRICKERHTDLATIRNQEENDLVVRLIKETVTNASDPSLGAGAWVGGTRDNSQRGYYWMTDGETVDTFENWNVNEPNNQGGVESCLMYYWSHAVLGWNDGNCDWKTAFVCEYY